MKLQWIMDNKSLKCVIMVVIKDYKNRVKYKGKKKKRKGNLKEKKKKGGLLRGKYNILKISNKL